MLCALLWLCRAHDWLGEYFACRPIAVRPYVKSYRPNCRFGSITRVMRIPTRENYAPGSIQTRVDLPDVETRPQWFARFGLKGQVLDTGEAVQNVEAFHTVKPTGTRHIEVPNCRPSVAGWFKGRFAAQRQLDHGPYQVHAGR